MSTQDPEFLVIDGDPATFLQAHNIFGSGDLVSLCMRFFEEVVSALQIEPSAEDRADWENAPTTSSVSLSSYCLSIRVRVQ